MQFAFIIPFSPHIPISLTMGNSTKNIQFSEPAVFSVKVTQWEWNFPLIKVEWGCCLSNPPREAQFVNEWMWLPNKNQTESTFFCSGWHFFLLSDCLAWTWTWGDSRLFLLCVYMMTQLFSTRDSSCSLLQYQQSCVCVSLCVQHK